MELISRTIQQVEIKIFNELFKSMPIIDSKFKNTFNKEIGTVTNKI
jgi:hypothetical protein